MVSYFKTYILGAAADKACREVHVSYDDGKKAAFMEGAEWTARYLLRAMNGDLVEFTATEKYLDKLRLRDVRECLRELMTEGESR